MMRFVFKKVSRAELTRIAINAAKALGDPKNYDNFEFSIDVDGDESCIERIVKGDLHKVDVNPPSNIYVPVEKEA